MTSDQGRRLSGQQAASALRDVSVVLVGDVCVVLLLWGVWALRTGPRRLAEDSISAAPFLGVAVRFVAMYVVLTFFLLS